MSISIFTKFVSQLISIKAYLDTRLRSECWCPLCRHQHTVPKICFSSEDRDITQLKLLLDILYNTLYFDWTEDGHQELIFSLCNYFLEDQDYCFPLFYCSLRHGLSIGPNKCIYRLLHGKCARTVFTHELLTYQKSNE